LLKLILDNSGNKLTIEAVGTLSQTLEKGAYVNLQVKYGLIRLINMKEDLCDQVSNVELECPIDEGKITIVKDVALPNEIPSVCPYLILILLLFLTYHTRELTQSSPMHIPRMMSILFVWKQR
jgi:hypothetical protein